MGEAQFVTVRFFGKLQTTRARGGLPLCIDVAVPPAGLTAQQVARELALPLDDVEAVFCNHRVYGLDHVVHPGDSVAFVPRGIPGPHRFTLGIYGAGRHPA